MISTKNIPQEENRISPILGMGNHIVRLNDLTIEPTPYDPESYNIYLHVETRPLGGGFQGFLKDPNNPNGPRYEGQVARVRMSPYPFNNNPIPNTDKKANRDLDIAKSIAMLADALGKRDEVDVIQAESCVPYVMAAARVLVGDEEMQICIGGREYRNKAGYIAHDLFLPRANKSYRPVGSLDDKYVTTFSEEYHVKKLKEQPTSNFEPASTGSDFDL